MNWVKIKSLILKRLFPRLAINKYCLKTNPDARYYLPSLNAQMDAVLMCPKHKRVDFVKDRVWSVDARGELYRNGMWQGLAPRNIWEFEYLLKNADFVGYSANLPHNRKKFHAFYLLIEAINNNTAFAELLVKKYVCVAEDIGPELLLENLSTDAFDAVMRVMTKEHQERALPFLLVASGNKDLYKNLFVSILSRDPEYLAEVKELIRGL
jgi:hypothetical protein